MIHNEIASHMTWHCVYVCGCVVCVCLCVPMSLSLFLCLFGCVCVSVGLTEKTLAVSLLALFGWLCTESKVSLRVCVFLCVCVSACVCGCYVSVCVLFLSLCVWRCPCLIIYTFLCEWVLRFLRIQDREWCIFLDLMFRYFNVFPSFLRLYD